MSDCRYCRFATWDYEGYYNTIDKQWFVSGCIKSLDDPEGSDCEEYEEIKYEHTD